MILCIIVTYNPEINRLKKNISSIIYQVERILIIDNNSKNIEEIEKYFICEKIEILKNIENLGIAFALNRGLNYSQIKDYEYILTLDQDSISTNKMVETLKKGFRGEENIAIVSPTVYDLNMNKFSTKQIKKEFEEMEVTITSGSLCKSNILSQVGGFKQELFIDYVDFELCLRLKRHGYKILLSREATLKHEVGKSVVKKILGMQFIITNHSPLRYYYMFRNSIYINNKYNKKFSKKWIKENLKLIKKLMGIVIWEKNRKEKLGKIFKGVKEAAKVGEKK